MFWIVSKTFIQCLNVACIIKVVSTRLNICTVFAHVNSVFYKCKTSYMRPVNSKRQSMILMKILYTCDIQWSV